MAGEDGDFSELEQAIIEGNANEQEDEATIEGNANEQEDEATIEGNANEPADEAIIEGNANEQADEAIIEGNANEQEDEATIEGNANEQADEAIIEGNANEQAGEATIEGNANEQADEAIIERNANEPADEAIIEGNANEPADEAIIEGNANEQAVEATIEGNANEPADEAIIEGNANEPADDLPKPQECSPLEVALLQQLTCPVCFEPCNAPIHMCSNGHNFCANCQMKLNKCPVCRASGPPTNRNLALEHLSDQILTVPCQFKVNGCGIKRKRQEDLEQHHRNCKFKVNYSYKCLVTATCDFEGGIPALCEHVRATHPNAIRAIGDEYYVDLTKTSSKTWVTLMKRELGNAYFWVICEHDAVASQVYFYTRHIGPSDEARKKIQITVEYQGKTTFLDFDISTKFTLSFDKKSLRLNEDYLSSQHCLELPRNYYGPTFPMDKVVIQVTSILL